MPSNDRLPLSVIVVTKNEGPRLARCLAALTAFDEVIVVDSASADDTASIARAAGVKVIDFQWAGGYPKKRQWCLDTLKLAHDWVFFVDADEVVPPALVEEVASLDFTAAGYFVKGSYVVHNKTLCHGLQNNKLCLFDRRRVMFPVVDDLDIPGMGEIEGHYQPVLRPEHEAETICQLHTPLLHYAFDDGENWECRHRRYAQWEQGMIARNAYPRDPLLAREILKRFFRRLPCRGEWAFFHSYVWKFGFLDGVAGWHFAQRRRAYYRMLTKVASSE